MTDTLTFDFDAVTPRMLIDFKAKTGVALMSLVSGGEFDMSVMSEEVVAGMIWLALRMGGKPDATWDEALDTPFTALNLGGEPVEPDPTTAS